MRLERSELAVPASNWRMIEKASSSDADLAFLDLEDAVATDAKSEARANVIRAFTELDWHAKPRVFRMNALDTPFFYRDLIEIVEVRPYVRRHDPGAKGKSTGGRLRHRYASDADRSKCRAD